MAIPDQFELLPASPFSDLIGPLYQRVSDGQVPVLGIEVAPQHANRVGRAHGGLLMTLADVAVSRATVAHIPPGSTIATAGLQIAFLEAVHPGQWLEASPTVDRIGRSLAHASCVITADGELVARMLATVAVRLARPE